MHTCVSVTPHVTPHVTLHTVYAMEIPDVINSQSVMPCVTLHIVSVLMITSVVVAMRIKWIPSLSIYNAHMWTYILCQSFKHIRASCWFMLYACVSVYVCVCVHANISNKKNNEACTKTILSRFFTPLHLWCDGKVYSDAPARPVRGLLSSV